MKVAVSHILEKLKKSNLCLTPFPHAVIDGFLPSPLFSEFLDRLPATQNYLRLERPNVEDQGKSERAILPLIPEELERLEEPSALFLDELAKALESEEIVHALIRKFGLEHRDPRIQQGLLRAIPQSILSRDFGPYEIGPHTDVPHRLISVILYLSPAIESKEYGTALFVPRERGRKCAQGLHYPMAEFKVDKIIDFLPNRALIFARCDDSFHGLAPFSGVHGARDTLLYEIAFRPSATGGAESGKMPRWSADLPVFPQDD